MSGRMLAQEIAKTRPTLKVVYMSGYTDDAIVHRGVLDAGTHFLAKPFTSSDLRRKIRTVLDDGIIKVADDYEPAVGAGASMEEEPLHRAALREIPADVRAKLSKAVIAARHDEIIEIVETLRNTAPEAATLLGRMADAFDYDGMRDLLDLEDEEERDG